MWTSIAMWCVIEIYWDVARKSAAPASSSESRASWWRHLLLTGAAQLLIFFPAYLRKIRLEEANLMKAFGAEYRDDRRETWALLPGLF